MMMTGGRAGSNMQRPAASQPRAALSRRVIYAGQKYSQRHQTAGHQSRRPTAQIDDKAWGVASAW